MQHLMISHIDRRRSRQDDRDRDRGRERDHERRGRSRSRSRSHERRKPSPEFAAQKPKRNGRSQDRKARSKSPKGSSRYSSSDRGQHSSYEPRDQGPSYPSLPYPSYPPQQNYQGSYGAPYGYPPVAPSM